MKKTSLLILSALILASCTNEPADTPYIYLKDNQTEFSFSSKGTVYASNGSKVELERAYVDGTSPRLELYSNYPGWEFQTEYPSDSQWIDCWPKSGSQCGRFYLSVDENPRAAARRANVNIVAKGKVVYTFSISQEGSAPYMGLDMGGLSSQTIVCEGGSFELRLNTNTIWTATCDQASWLTFEDQGDTSVKVVVAENTDEDSRSADIAVSPVGTGLEELACSFTVFQQGTKTAFRNAEKVTIAQLLGDKMNGNIIEDNIYVEGTVINDIENRNFEQHLISYNKIVGGYEPVFSNRQIFVQDESGKGFIAEFIDPSMCTYTLGTRVTLHIPGMSVVTDQATGARKVSGLTSAQVREAEQGGQATPVVLESGLDRLEDYENCLVTLKNVSFAMTAGTLFNSDERFVSDNTANTAWAIEDSSRGYSHVLVAADGSSAYMTVSSAFVGRNSIFVPAGTCDVTGVVTRRKTLDHSQFVLRIRNVADIAQTSESSLFRTLVRFGPFADNADAPSVKAGIGKAQLKTSVMDMISAKSAANKMYWVDSWVYRILREDVLADSPSVDLEYRCINAQQWYNATGSSIDHSQSDTKGEAWIINVDEFKPTGGKLYLVFTAASYNKGPAYFQLEWNESEGAPTSEWHAFEAYRAASWNCEYHMKTYFFPLPDELKSLEKFTIRHRVSANEGVYVKGTAMNTTGTSRLGWWSIIEM